MFQHLTYRANAKKTIILSFESPRKVGTSWRHLLLQITSVKALDGVTSFYPGKTLQIHVNICDWLESFSAMVESWKKLKTSNVFFVVYCVLESK